MVARFFRSHCTLSHPLYVSFKSALATLLAIAIDSTTGNSDHVSAAFVAVLSIAPTVFQGLKQAALQFLGSLLGGLCGAICMGLFLWGDWPLLYAIPPGVFLAIMGAFFFRQPGILIVAAFTALFLPNFQSTPPLMTLQMRLMAVTTGAFSGFVVNTLVSAFAHERIFSRRWRKLLNCLADQLPATAEIGPRALSPVYSLLGQLEEELRSAELDLAYTKRKKAIQLIQALMEDVKVVHYLLHLIHVDYFSCQPEDHTKWSENVRWISDRLGGRTQIRPASFTAPLPEIELCLEKLCPKPS